MGLRTERANPAHGAEDFDFWVHCVIEIGAGQHCCREVCGLLG